jgi:hypothetical protein
MYDLEYYNNGMFTRFIPNTPSGVEAWHVMAKDNGNAAVWSAHAQDVIAQLRKAGYSVAKAKKPTKITAQEVDQLLAELGV